MSVNKITYIGEDYDDEIESDSGLEMSHSMVGETLAVDILTATVMTQDIPVRLLTADQGEHDFLYTADGAVLCVSGGAKEPEYVRNAPALYCLDDDLIGKYYINAVNQKGPHEHALQAYSAIWLLEQTKHFGGLYSGETAGVVIADIIGDVVPYAIDDDISAIEVYGYLPYATRRSNLQMVLMAIGAAVKNASDGSLRITTLSETVTGTFDESRVFIGGSVTDKTPVTAVQVTEHHYIESEDTETIYSDTTISTETVIFKEPYHDLVVTNGTVISSGANYCTFTGAGAVTITGQKYTHITRIVTQGIAPTGGFYDVVKTITDNTLINPVNSADIAENLYNYLSISKTIKQEVVVETERPGDVVNVIHPYTRKLISACVKSMSLQFGNSEVRAVCEFLAGYTPPGVVSGFTSYATLTGSGSWTVPAGITKIRAIVCSGGNGGHGGYPGGDSEEQASGDGGLAGDAGLGGLIYEVNLTVTPGSAISYSCGAGGAGGASGTDGTVGADTTFGSVSSSVGRRYPYGYTEPKSGNELCKDGNADGIAGSQGSSNYTGDGPDITYNGTTYTHGETGEYTTINGVYNWPGRGGGPAVGADGSDGGDGFPFWENGKWVSGIGHGGHGGDASARDAAPGYGTGGDGGHGGGGAGQGSTQASRPWSDGIYGLGGSGGDGGDGAPGCVIIYY